MTQQEYVDILKSAALASGKDAVMTYLVSQFPFFSITLVNPITSMVVGYILKILIKYSEFGAFFFYIDLRGKQQGKAFEAAAVEYEKIKKTGSKSEIEKYEKNLINSFRDLAKFSN